MHILMAQLVEGDGETLAGFENDRRNGVVFEQEWKKVLRRSLTQELIRYGVGLRRPRRRAGDAG